MPVTTPQGDTRPSPGAPARAEQGRFDGVICFGGEDWWYHNRGHFDMQMMRRLSRSVPVVYVNSIGMRVPRPQEGRMFAARIARKLGSLRRGHVRIRNGFSVITPAVLPGRVTFPLTRGVLTWMVRAAARRERIRAPLVWVACPTGAEAVDALDPAAVVYQRTDRYEAFHGIDVERIRSYDRWLKARGDLTVFCSRMLYERETEDCRRAAYIDHGVDYDRFLRAAFDATGTPADMASLPRPRIGFVGGIDAHTFDPALFCEVARRRPHLQFVLVGSCSLSQGWCALPNVTLLGQRPYEAVPRYLAACDALIMPWRRSRWIEACNPVKLKEYLAAGRPIVSTEFPELHQYEGLLRTANEPETFAAALDAALAQPFDARPGRSRVQDHTWRSKATAVLAELEQLGVTPKPRSPLLAALKTPQRRPTRTTQAEAGRGNPCGPNRAGGPRDDRRTLGGQEARRPARVNIAGHAQERCSTRRQNAEPGAAAPIDLVACLLLAGGLRPSPITEAASRSVLDLWLTPMQSVLDCWVDRIEELERELASRIDIRAVHDAMNAPPWPDPRVGRRVTVEQDPKPFRGPAGLARDLCIRYAGEQHVILAEAGRYSAGSLGPLVEAHARAEADVTVASNPDGSPGGIYVLRSSSLEIVASAGFTDLKEQWLRRAVDAGLRIMVHHLPHPGAMPLRTLGQFLAAARAANGLSALPPSVESDATDMATGAANHVLRVVCGNAFIGPGARVVDSIVMPGAIIGADAVVVRSLVCPDSQIQAGTDIADAVVSAGAQLSDGGALRTRFTDPA